MPYLAVLKYADAGGGGEPRGGIRRSYRPCSQKIDPDHDVRRPSSVFCGTDAFFLHHRAARASHADATLCLHVEIIWREGSALRQRTHKKAGSRHIFRAGRAVSFFPPYLLESSRILRPPPAAASLCLRYFHLCLPTYAQA